MKVFDPDELIPTSLIWSVFAGAVIFLAMYVAFILSCIPE